MLSGLLSTASDSGSGSRRISKEAALPSETTYVPAQDAEMASASTAADRFARSGLASRVVDDVTDIGGTSADDNSAFTAPGLEPFESSESSEAAQQVRELVIRRAVLVMLDAEGLKETAACLRKEANIAASGDSQGNMEVAMEVLLAPGLLPAEVSAEIRRGINGRPITPPALSMAETTQHMAEQRKSAERLHLKIKMLREEGEQWLKGQNGSTSGEDTVKAVLQYELESKRVEVEKLQKALEERQADTASLQTRLKQVRAETDHFLALAATQPKPQLDGQEAHAEKIRRILATWDAPGGARRSCSQLFAKIDVNHDGRLEWNNGEIKSFVRLVFKQLQVQLPPWQDPVWYDLYRRCDIDGSFSLDLEESFRFAKTCLETALHCLDPVLLTTSPQHAPVPLVSPTVSPGRARFDVSPNRVASPTKVAAPQHVARPVAVSATTPPVSARSRGSPPNSASQLYVQQMQPVPQPPPVDHVASLAYAAQGAFARAAAAVAVAALPIEPVTFPSSLGRFPSKPSGLSVKIDQALAKAQATLQPAAY